MREIGIVASPGEPGVSEVTAMIEARGHGVRFLDPAGEAWPAAPGRTVLDPVAAIWVPRPVYMSAVPDWVPDPGAWADARPTIHSEIRAAQETRSLVASTLDLAAGRIPMVNPPAASRAMRLVTSLLRAWARYGLPVAPFVAGNDLERVAYFVDRHRERCRVRRLWDRPWEERPADFQYLKEHHRDTDRFPWIVRAHMGGPTVTVLVVGRAPVLSVRWAAGVPEVVARAEHPAAAALALRAMAAIPAAVGMVHMELDEAGRAYLVGIPPEVDVAWLDSLAGGDVASRAVAALLVDLADTRVSCPGAAVASLPPREVVTYRWTPVPRGGGQRRGPRVGLAGRQGDMEIRALAAALSDIGADPRPVELPLFPLRRAMHEEPGASRIGATEFGDLDALFLRTTGWSSVLPEEGAAPPTEERWASLRDAYRRNLMDQGECFEFKYATLEVLGSEIPVINPPRVQEIHRTKVHQLMHLTAGGVPVPEFLVSRDRGDLEAFARDLGGPDRVVVKPLAGIYKTDLLSRTDLARALEAGPVMLQRYVPGDTVRAYLVGRDLVGAGVILHEPGHVDSSIGQLGVEPVDLPPGAREAALEAMDLLGLAWTGMDFIVDPGGGGWWILECNASPMFATFSRKARVDVPGALARYLVELAEGGW